MRFVKKQKDDGKPDVRTAVQRNRWDTPDERPPKPEKPPKPREQSPDKVSDPKWYEVLSRIADALEDISDDVGRIADANEFDSIPDTGFDKGCENGIRHETENER